MANPTQAATAANPRANTMAIDPLWSIEKAFLDGRTSTLGLESVALSISDSLIEDS